ncbi:hypothetical protein [Synechococcus sp. A15-60]|nr:hypothetical protein [Synechococcus sp. A15-60]QNI48109.1 hypothetical protein SynA1560_01450 [Synechococcus sp. A15-60]
MLRSCFTVGASQLPTRHSGGMSTNEEWIRELLGAIRKKLEAGELD